MAIAHGIRKQTIYKKQGALGTAATGAGGQILRRRTAVFDLARDTFENDEINTHQQSTGVRHGTNRVTGRVNGLVSPDTYADFMASAVRKDFAAGATTGALITVTAATTSGADGTFTRSAGSYLTDGLKVGDIVRWTGWATTGTPNNSRNQVIMALTETVMTVRQLDGVAVGAKAAGDSVTCTVVGKKAVAPLTSQTDDLFTFEEAYQDVTQYEQFIDCKLNTMSINVPATGNNTIDLEFMGLNRTFGTAQTLTSPTSETVTGVTSALQGLLVVEGSAVGNVTAIQFQVAENVTADGPVVGSKFSPDLAQGTIKVSGQLQCYFSDTVLVNLYDDETPTSIIIALMSDATATSDFVCFTMGRVKLTSATPDDGEKGIMRTYNFTAEINSAGGAALAWDQTILSIQDSAA